MNLKEKIYYNYNNYLLKIGYKIYKNKKVQNNYIVFQSEGDYCDNARALTEYIKANDRNKRYVLFWIVKNTKKHKDSENEKFIKYYSWNPIKILKKALILSQSKYFLFTHPWWFNKLKNEQIVVNLWHGITFKNPTSNKIANSCDLNVCQSENIADWLSKFTGAPKEKMIFCGYPRNDFLTHPSKKSIELLNKGNKKIVFCMPTYNQTKGRKDSEKINKFIIPYCDTQKDLKTLDELLGEKNIKLIVKPHHLQILDEFGKVKCKNIEFFKDEMLAEKDINLYEILGQADALLTDISSVYIDFLLLNRPIGFFMEDVREYAKKRGYMIDNYEEYMPGKFINNKSEFFDFFDDLVNEKDEYSDKREEINNYVNKYKNNHSKRLLKMLNIEI